MILYYILVFTLPLMNHHWLGAGGTFGIVKYLGFVCLPIACFRLVTRPSVQGLFNTGVLPSFAIYLFLMLLTHFIHGGTLGLDSHGWNPLLAVAAMLAFMVLTVSLVDTFTRFRRVLLIMMGSVAVTSIYVLRDWMVNRSIPGYRPGSISGDANYYGVCASTCLVVGLHLLLTHRPRWEKLYVYGCLLATAVGFLLASSRGGLVGLAAGVAFLMVRSGRGLRIAALLSLLLIPLLLFVPSGLVQRITNPGTGDEDAIRSRTIVWRAGLKMIMDNPFLGVGLNHFEFRVTRYEQPDDLIHGQQVWSVAHNTYIEIAAELGIPGLMAYLALLISGFRAWSRVVRSKSELLTTRLREDCVALQAGLVTAAACTFFVSAWWFRFMWLVWFLPACLPSVEQSLTRQAQVQAPEAALVLARGVHQGRPKEFGI